VILGLGGGVGLPLVAAFTKHLAGRDMVPAAIALCGVVLYLLARTLYGSRAHARETALRELADTLVTELGAGDARYDAGAGGSASASGENVRVAAPVLAPSLEDAGDDDPTADAVRRAGSATR
jgi:hypothetical protein